MTANPVELSREDIQHIRELVNLNRLGNFAERTGARMALRNYLLNGADYTRMDALVDAALRGMESQGVTDAMVGAACNAFDISAIEASMSSAEFPKQMRSALEAALGARTEPRGEKS